MNQLIDDMLNYSKINKTNINKEKVSMKKIINAVLKMFVLDIDKYNCTINIDDLPKALADRSLITQVWSNLISNAIKFSSKTENPTIHIGDESISQVKDTLIESPADLVHFISNESQEIARILVIKAPRP